MFTVGVALLVFGYGSVYTGVLHLLAQVKGDGQLPAYKSDQPQPAPGLLTAFGFGYIGPAVGKKLTPSATFTASTGSAPPTSSTVGRDQAPPGPVTINVNGKPVTLTPSVLQGVLVGLPQTSPTAGLAPMAVR